MPTNPFARNRAERRKKVTRKDAEGLLRNAFADRIAFVAARHLLVEVANDQAASGLAGDLPTRIELFLARHPVKERP